MNALLLDGSAAGDAPLEAIRSVLIEELAAARWEVNPLTLRDMRIAPCTGCFDCWLRSPGICKQHDEGRDVARAMMRSDLMIFLTRLTFGGYSSHLKKAVERLIPNLGVFLDVIGGEVHHGPRYQRYPSLLGVAVTDFPEPETTSIFEQLVSRNARNIFCPAHTAGVLAAAGDTGEARGLLHGLLARVGVRS